MVPTDSMVAVVVAIYLGLAVLWLLLAGFVGRAVGGNKGRRRWLVTLAFALAPLLVPVAQVAQERFRGRSEHLATQHRSNEAEGYFTAACAARPALPTSRTVVDGSGGVDIIAAGGSLATTDVAGDLAALQYATPLRWTVDAQDLEPAVRAGFAFVESGDAASGLMRALAPRDWWKATGHLRLDAIDWQGLAANMDRGAAEWFEADIRPPSQARYELRLQDVSTHDDRDHWVGRGRMRLVDRRDGRVVAEYIGLSVNARPGLESMADSASGWQATRECGAPEQRYANSLSMWPALAFFFGEIVKVE